MSELSEDENLKKIVLDANPKASNLNIGTMVDVIPTI